MGENPPAADDRGSRETAQASESQQMSGCSGNDCRAHVEKKVGHCWKLTPCSDSKSSVLTLTDGIPSSINILFSKVLIF